MSERQKKIMDFISSNQPIKLTDLVLAMPEISSHTLVKKEKRYLVQLVMEIIYKNQVKIFSQEK